MNTQPECYGQMFPPMLEMSRNRAISGAVFGYRVDMPGVAVTNRNITVNQEAWQRCVDCPALDSCYRLSHGTLLMQLAVTR